MVCLEPSLGRLKTWRVKLWDGGLEGGWMATQTPIPAPEFPEGLEWANTRRPVRMADMQGRLVILDFWTFC